MIKEEFKEAIRSNRGTAVIMAGSDSDKDHIDKIVKSLQKYGIYYDVRICSAHKQPDKLMSLIREYNEVRGLVSYITVAGGTDALSGILSYHALGPVISCPPDGLNRSCLSNPQGSSNAYIERPANVGRFIAQMYAGINSRFREIIQQENENKINSLESSDFDFREHYLREK